MIDINCDLGEGLNNEHLLMPYISTCNIACGGHAGNEKTMNRVVNLAAKNKVKIGAHPSYPDIENFGRKSIEISMEGLKKTLVHQIQALEKIVLDSGHQMHHIKPHGALYNDVAKNESIAFSFLYAIQDYKTKCKLYVPFGSVIERKAKQSGFTIIYEAFADRNYNDDLSLVSRQKNNAIISNPNEIIKHISLIKNDGKVLILNQ